MELYDYPPLHRERPQPPVIIYYTDKDANTTTTLPAAEDDPVNHPSHYTAYGAEVIDITEHLSFNRGNAIKYIARAGLKDKDKELQDLEKAMWYLTREIALYKRQQEKK